MIENLPAGLPPETPPAADLSAPGAPPAAQPAGLHRSSLALAILSGLGLLVALLIAGGLFLLGLTGMAARGRAAGLASQTDALFSIGWVSLLVAMLQLPALALSIRRLTRRPAPTALLGQAWLLATLGLVLMVPLVVLGQYLAHLSNEYSLLYLPPLQLLVIGLPVWWSLEIGRRGLDGGSAQREWGITSFSTLVTMPVVVVLELLEVVFLGVLAFTWLASQPQVAQEIQNLLQSFENGNIDPFALSQLVQPYLHQPVFIFLVLAVAAVLIPLLEEAFKPLALWFLAGRKLTLAQGFVGGLICGAVFALLESLFSLSPAAGSDWAGVVVGRMGTGLLHATCSGLVGWGLAAAWRRQKYLQLGGMYLLAVLMHGTWNTFGLLSGLIDLLDPVHFGVAYWMATNGSYVLFAMVFLTLAILLYANRYLRTHPDPAEPESISSGPPAYDPFANMGATG